MNPTKSWMERAEIKSKIHNHRETLIHSHILSPSIAKLSVEAVASNDHRSKSWLIWQAAELLS